MTEQRVVHQGGAGQRGDETLELVTGGPVAGLGRWCRRPRIRPSTLTARVPDAPGGPVKVLDISETGMLVDGAAFPRGADVTFALEGAGVRATGTGRFVRRTNEQAGIAVRWNGNGQAAVRDMVERALLAASTWQELYVHPPASPRPASELPERALLGASLWRELYVDPPAGPQRTTRLPAWQLRDGRSGATAAGQRPTGGTRRQAPRSLVGLGRGEAAREQGKRPQGDTADIREWTTEQWKRRVEAEACRRFKREIRSVGSHR